MPVTLDRLQELLQENEEKRRQGEAEEAQLRSKYEPLQEKIDEFYRSIGMELPSTGHWIRPFPLSWYKNPLSAPQTTLVPWETLPKPIQDKLGATPPASGVAEVPISLIIPDDQQDTGAANLQKRPLGGNLTTRLKEYTQGVSGQTKPFRAGGLDKEELGGTDENQFCSPEEIQRNAQVLQQGSKASWRDGTIRTAPPGADFDVGLSWKDVYGEDVPYGIDSQPEKTVGNDDNGALDNEVQAATPKSIYRPQTMWDTTFLDDDSLFGDSDDESDDEADEEEENAEADVEADKLPAEETNEVEAKIQSKVSISDQQQGIVGVDDVDELLSELSITDSVRTKKSLTELPSSNPLQLAQQHAQMAQQSSRKAWAVTKLLPIDDFNSFIPNPAMTYPFTLDDFQQQAVARLERSESIFVAAHTSAGKTVCAEYAISLCKQHCTRAIYTSPIKALSNQKFRDFCQKFGAENVGLVTGDMQLNVDDSTCLIMTTEILRSMLYRGADLVRDIEWVIFDECHYINDSERGVVWEEVIIMLPQYVNMIFLSATTPNTVEFSDWIGRTKRKPVHVIRTNYRPVPLSHNLWAGHKLHKIMEGRGGFLDKGYKEASSSLKPAKEQKGDQKRRSQSLGSKNLAWQTNGSKANWMSLVRFLERESLTPTVVFSFSKKKCEEIANMLRSLDLNTAVERGLVQGFTLQTVARLSPGDSVLPQVLTVCDMVKRGIGVHHGGLLPILKEMVEILFSRNLIKVLFATETFAMGVNMPARAVVFNSIRKHDGTQFRQLEPGEYTQMAGRAGRRGLDKVGTVIMCCFGEEPPPLPILRNMLTGSSTKLSSQFRLTYNMILNLLRVEDMSVEGMIKRSFSEFATQRALTANEYPKLLARGERTYKKLEEEFTQNASGRAGAEDIDEYYRSSAELLSLNQQLISYILENDGANPLTAGRICLVTSARKHGYVRTPAMVLRSPEAQGVNTRTSEAGKVKTAVCLVLLPTSYIVPTPDQQQKDSKPKISTKSGSINYVGDAKRRKYAIHEISLDEVLLVSTIKQKIKVETIFKEEKMGGRGRRNLANPFANTRPMESGFDNAFAGMKARTKKDGDDFFGGEASKPSNEGQVIENVMEALLNAESREEGGDLPVMDLRDCVRQGHDVLEFRQTCSLVQDLVAQVRSCLSHTHPAIEGDYAAYERKETLRQRVETLKHLLSNESLQLFPDFLQRKRVLRSLDYIDDNETVCVKGRVACEVNTCEELVATELVFEGILNELEPAEIVAALSSLVYQAKGGDDDFDAELPETLVECCKQMKTIATNLGQLQKEHGLDVDPVDYCEASLKFGLVHVVYEWALGVSFSNICELTDVQEGSIVRCITRLDELCREIRNCARVVGNPTLYRKMETASMAIKRDIVFASSLYVS